MAIWRSEWDICGSRELQTHLCGRAPYHDDAGSKMCLSEGVLSQMHLDRVPAKYGLVQLAARARSQDDERQIHARRLYLLVNPWNAWGKSELDLCDLSGQDPAIGP